MIRGVFKFVFGLIAAVVIIGLIVLVTFVIGHAVTGSWNPAEWKKSDDVAAIVTEYQYDYDSTLFDNYTLEI